MMLIVSHTLLLTSADPPPRHRNTETRDARTVACIGARASTCTIRSLNSNAQLEPPPSNELLDLTQCLVSVPRCVCLFVCYSDRRTFAKSIRIASGSMRVHACECCSTRCSSSAWRPRIPRISYVRSISIAYDRRVGTGTHERMNVAISLVASHEHPDNEPGFDREHRGDVHRVVGGCHRYERDVRSIVSMSLTHSFTHSLLVQ